MSSPRPADERWNAADLRVRGARMAGTTSRDYWRSLDELAGTADFEELVHREFPDRITEWNDPVGRRRFLQLVAASLALAGVTGCTRQPQEPIVPYVRAPEDLIPGRPQYYATAMVRGGYALGLLVESHLGRPTKIEGNPEHPASQGATDSIAQASILDLYDPDRSQTVIHRGAIQTWDRFLTTFATELESLKSRRGRGLRVLTETVTSPTLAGQLQQLLKDLPEARWHQYEPAGLDNVRAGARLAFGRDVQPLYHFDKARVVLSLDCDFLSVLPGSVRYARDFISGRRARDDGSMNRLFVAESTPTITGATADHRLPLRPSRIAELARAVHNRVSQDAREGAGGEPPEGIPEAWLKALVDDLRDHRGQSLVLAGPGQPPEVPALAHAINAALKNNDQTVEYLEPIEARPESQLDSLRTLAADMAAGRVETLVILGGNPVYTAPGPLRFREALSKVRLRVHLSQFFDETSFLCDWHIPEAHALESWGDARAFDGTATILQPLIAPLYGGKTACEVLSVVQGQPGRSAYELVQEHWQQVLGKEDFGRQWRRALHDGVVAEKPWPKVDVEIRPTETKTPSDHGAGAIEIEFRTDSAVWDGRYANNGWLQELPRPLTKLTWDNAAHVSPATAAQLGLSNGDVLEIVVDGHKMDVPAWIMPGQPDDCVSLTFGYGRTRAGRVGEGVGSNVYAIRPLLPQWFAEGTVRKTGRRHTLVSTQNHQAMEGRDIVRVVTAAESRHAPHAAHEHEEHLPSLYGEEEDAYAGNKWAMVIDQTACIGCNACVVACQAENNVPIVGKEQVAAGREMHWLRVDVYHRDGVENPETSFQPMMCLHCEKAPCEVVCPVAATVHDHEGTSNMIYNRCVGTRYCSNNCPYKVRRFNWLQYTDETTPSLKLLRNPDVTVRSRGVMEKCSYCIQRINHARIDAKTGNRPIADGEVLTACQQVCPTEAIVFGNLNDLKSKVRKVKQSPLNYGVLAELNTQPRTTHLARVINPHPELGRMHDQTK